MVTALLSYLSICDFFKNNLLVCLFLNKKTKITHVYLFWQIIIIIIIIINKRKTKKKKNEKKLIRYWKINKRANIRSNKHFNYIEKLQIKYSYFLNRIKYDWGYFYTFNHIDY